jgi:methyltransferase (TIGR00027 family)
MTEQANWDIVTGVGLTALAVAAGRAIETHRPDRLVADPYAEAFVQAAQPPVPLPTRAGDDHDPAIPWESMATYMGVRSKFFDDFFAAASEAGIRQAVLFAAGLDCRAFRLEWPSGTTVYELDAPRVLDFKDQVLDRQGAGPRCERRTVACDLREDWPSALRKAGFDPGMPTAWLAEGLLPFLPDEAKETLLARMDELSAPGSRIAAEHLNGDAATLLREPPFGEMADRFGFDLSELWPVGQNLDVAGWLAGHGWSVTTDPATEVGGRYGRPFDDVLLQPMRSSLLISAQALDR